MPDILTSMIGAVVMLLGAMLIDGVTIAVIVWSFSHLWRKRSSVMRRNLKTGNEHEASDYTRTRRTRHQPRSRG